MNVIDKFFNFELTSKKNEEVLKKSSSLMDIAEYIYNKYRIEHPENFTDECSYDNYECYEWSSGF